MKAFQGAVAIVLIFNFTAYAQTSVLNSTSGCMYQIDRITGTVTFNSNCPSDMAQAIVNRAQKERMPNAGDFEELSKKLDRIIQLLEAKH